MEALIDSLPAVSFVCLLYVFVTALFAQLFRSYFSGYRRMDYRCDVLDQTDYVNHEEAFMYSGVHCHPDSVCPVLPSTIFEPFHCAADNASVCVEHYHSYETEGIFPNFYNFGETMFTLFRISTLDKWVSSQGQ